MMQCNETILPTQKLKHPSIGGLTQLKISMCLGETEISDAASNVTVCLAGATVTLLNGELIISIHHEVTLEKEEVRCSNISLN
jgi:hypothetical protein